MTPISVIPTSAHEFVDLSLPGGVPLRTDFARGLVTFIGTATVLIRYAGITVLTDPNFIGRGESIPLGFGLSTTRLTNPAMSIDELPPVDLVVLSHLHADHFDRVAEERLDRTLPIVTTRQAAVLLGRKGFVSTHGLARWQSFSVAKGPVRLDITALPARHAPGPLAALLPSTMGSLLQFSTTDGHCFRLYITGDTLFVNELREIPRRYPAIDLALVHLGGTRLAGVLLTLDARQGLRLLRLIQPATAIPIHYNDYPVFRSPLSDFQRLAERARWRDRIAYLEHGETHVFDVAAPHGTSLATP